MAITDENTVLVLGAGTSAPFGLPLGGGMISDLSKAIKREKGFLGRVYKDGRNYSSSKLRGAARGRKEFSEIPIHGTVALSHSNEDTKDFDLDKLDNDLNKLAELEQLLENQTSETIDDFIVENPSYAHLTKIGIAASFIKLCYDFESSDFTIKPFSERYHPPKPRISEPGKFDAPERNWVHLLINIVRNGIRSGSVSPENKIQIITFNYDKILEYVLDEQFSNTEAGYTKYSEYVDIIHVHGECGSLNDAIGKNPAKACLDWAEGIFVVNEETVPNTIGESRKKAKMVIAAAEELYFCGFAFAGANCRLLDLNSLDRLIEPRFIWFCNYEGNIGISRNAKKYEELGDNELELSPRSAITHLEEDSGSFENPLSVSDWLKSGRLGELP